MKASLLFLSLPIAAALAFAPGQTVRQDPQAPGAPNSTTTAPDKPTEVVVVMPLSEMRYCDLQGKTVTVSARDVVEIRLFEGLSEHVLIELLYDNGVYSLIQAQAIHLLRNGPSTRDVRLVRSAPNQMRFPRLP